MTPLSVSFVLTILASISALLSAWFWFKSSRVNYAPTQFGFDSASSEGPPNNMPEPTAFIQGAPAATTVHVDAATIEHSRKVAKHSQEMNRQISDFVAASSSLNVKASFWTACAAFLGGIATVLSQLGF